MTSNDRDPKLDERRWFTDRKSSRDSIFLIIKLLKPRNKTVTVLEYNVIRASI